MPGDPRPPSEPSSERSAELVSVIRAEIEANPDRRITFARFMERALYEPGLGYYRQGADRPTDAGDFLTAPETHPIFGWTVARRIERMWADLGEPQPFTLVEYGAGSGTLALSVFEGLRRHGSTALLEALRYEPIESNPHRLADLSARFEAAGLADRLTGRLAERTAASGDAATSSPAGQTASTATDGLVPVTGVLLANEFLDALPVHRVVVREGELLELFVVWRDGAAAGFAEVAAEPSTPALVARLADDGVALVEGQVAEICLGLDPWLDEVAGRLARGYVLIVDYGYEAAELYGLRRLAGTLLGYRGHRVESDPFASIGLTDLTAHVDFTALRHLGERRGFGTLDFTTQSQFLVASGLESELRALQESPKTVAADYLRARSGVVRMLDPRHMGRFRVLILGRGVAGSAH
jgi:SAM-dependent MidA family methyltransferase